MLLIRQVSVQSHMFSVSVCVQAVWRAEPVNAGVQLRLTSPDGDQGYPGELQVSVTYTLKANQTFGLFSERFDQTYDDG